MNLSEQKLSTCCGATDRETYEDGPSYEDIGFCSDCKDHCEYAYMCEDCSETESECTCEARQMVVNTLIGTVRDYVAPHAPGLIAGAVIGFAIAASFLVDNSELLWR